MLPAQELEALFDDNVPYLFQRDLANLVFRCFTEADTAQNVFGFRRPLSRWLAPYLRRTLILSQAFELAGRYQEIQADFRCTIGGGNPFLEMKAGQFLITISKTDEPGMLPRDAVFRTTNSSVNYSLFAAEEATSDPIYVILAYVPHPTQPQPMHLEFQIPDGEYSCILHRIDLLERFFAGIEQTPTEETPTVDPQPKLRPPKSETGEAQS